MLLRRTLFVLDFVVLLAVFVILMFFSAERCLSFRAHEYDTKTESKCHLHPVHHPEFSFTQNPEANAHMSMATHHVTICHRLQWYHYSFWDSMYMIVLPALACLLLLAYTLCELCEFDIFAGSIQSTALVTISLFTVFYVISVISHEKARIETEWPLLWHAHVLGAEPGQATVQVPQTWQYSIAMCILSAFFKIGRILIQHFFGDKKMFFEYDTPSEHPQNSAEKYLKTGNPEIPGTVSALNESRYSRIEEDSF